MKVNLLIESIIKPSVCLFKLSRNSHRNFIPYPEMKLNYHHEQQQPQHPISSESSFFQRLSQCEQAHLISELVNYMMSPAKQNSRMHQLSEKFKQIQLQIVTVIQHRVGLQHRLQLSRLQESHFETVCQLYSIIKQRDNVINELGRKNAQIDTMYLMKVAELEQQRIYNERLMNKYEQVKWKLAKQSVNSNMDGNKINHYNQQNDIAQIEMEIISLKQAFKTVFQKNNSIISTQQLDLTAIQRSSQAQRQPPVNLSTELSKQLQLLKSHLNLRLEIIDQSDDITQKYQSTQQQLIDTLIDQLIRIKTLNNSSLNLPHYNSKTILNDSQSIQQAYEKSQNSLNDLLEMELIQMKGNVEKVQHQLQLQLDVNSQLKVKILEGEDKLRQSDQKHQILQKKILQNQQMLDKESSNYNEQLQQSQLVYESRIQQMQLKRIEQGDRNNIMMNKNAQKIHTLEQQLNKANYQLTTIHQQLTKAHQQHLSQNNRQLQQIHEANQSLQNQKILLKSLNKKLNKELNQAIEEKNKILKENVQIKQSIVKLQNKLQEKQQQLNQLKLSHNFKQQQINELRNEIQVKQKLLQQALKDLQQLKQLNHSSVNKSRQKQRDINVEDKKYREKYQQLLNDVQEKSSIIDQLQQGLKQSQQKNTTYLNEIQIVKKTNLDPQTTPLNFQQYDLQHQSSQNSNKIQVSVKDEQLQLQQRQLHVQLQQLNQLQQLKQERNKLQQTSMGNQQRLQQLMQKQTQIVERQTELNYRQVQLNHKEHLLNNEKQKLNITIQNQQQKQEQLKSTQSRQDQNQKQLKQQLSQLQYKNAELQQQIHQLEYLINHTKQINDKILSSDSPSPPPSPHQSPLSSPPECLSPFKLQSSQRNISLLQVDKPRLTLINSTNSQMISQDPLDVEEIRERCEAIAKQWMKSQDTKWKALHKQIEEIYQMVLRYEV